MIRILILCTLFILYGLQVIADDCYTSGITAGKYSCSEPYDKKSINNAYN